MTGCRHVSDYTGVPDGNAAIAAISLGMTYSCTCLNPHHKSYLRNVIESGLVHFISVPGPFFQGDATKALVLKHFPKTEAIAATDVDDDSSDD